MSDVVQGTDRGQVEAAREPVLSSFTAHYDPWAVIQMNNLVHGLDVWKSIQMSNLTIGLPETYL